ncbi:MAG: LysM peptidoglycan-binding domain-containing protein [Candidatus Limnocylindrales bacterium]
MRIGRARVSQGLTPGGDFASPGPVSGAESLAGVDAPPTAAVAPASRPAGQGTAPVETVDLGPRFRPWSEAGQSSPGPIRCEFLRSVGPDGRLAEAQKTAVPTHRCAAFGDPLPLSLRQQELVCLQRVHVSCPRYVRGTLLATEQQAQPASAEKRRAGMSVLTVAGVGLFLLALGILFTGLLGLPPFGGGSSPSRHPIAAASASASSSAATNPTATSSPTLQPSSTVVATPTPSPAPTPGKSPQPSATAAASASWPPGATASRMNLLVPCTDQPNCYLYTVRGPGANGSSVADTVDGVARFFGVSTSSIYSLNPWATAGVNPGDTLKIPPPTR